MLNISSYFLSIYNSPYHVALIGVATLGILAANVVSSYTMEAVGANA